MTSAHTLSVPRLETDRFLLREYRRADFAPFAAHFAAHFAPSLAQDLAHDLAHDLAPAASAADLAPPDSEAAWRIFCSHAGLWLLHGAGWWAVEEKQTGQLVGTVGAFFREHSPVMELGWNTYSAFRGQGCAVEAASAALHYALEVRREPRVQALIAPGNASSMRVAQRLGFMYEADTTLYGKALGCYTREREGSVA